MAFVHKKTKSDINHDELLNSIVNQLCEKEYEAISVIDVKKSTYTLLKFSYEESLVKSSENLDYHKGIRRFAQKFIPVDEQQNYLRKAALSTILLKLNEDETYTYTVNCLSLLGEKFLKKVTYFYIGNSNHKILVATEDISDIVKRGQQKLNKLQNALETAEQANKEKTDFLARMSHDMRTPLNSILNFANFIQSASTLDEAKEFAHKIYISGNYLQTLINDTLGMSRIESGKIELHLEPYIYSEFEPCICSVVEQKAKSKGVLLRFIPPAVTAQYVMFDKLRIQQIFVNLLNNAIKFTPPGGIVEMKTELSNQTDKYEDVIFTVTDTGIGMSKEFLETKLFQPFSQEHVGLDNEETGTGLGLSIAKQLVEIMGGSIECESVLGEGTKFTVILPAQTVSNYHEEKNKIEKTDIKKLEGCRVLLCEDHPLNREIAGRLLKKIGCLTEYATNGQEGLKLFSETDENYYDVILMDIRMPILDGLQCAKAIRNMDRADAKSIPIIAMTANAFDEDQKKSFDAGMNAHLAKPIEPDKLYETLAKCIEK